MAEFIPEPIQIYLELLNDCVLAGDFDLLETIDCRNFAKKDLQFIYLSTQDYLNFDIDDRRPDYDVMRENINKCLEIIRKQICSTDCWELKNYNVYTHCFKDLNYNCIHKVFDKNTQTYCAFFTGQDIRTLMAQENIKSFHFQL